MLNLKKLGSVDLPLALEPLTQTLHAAVHAGASISFILPFTPEAARRFWQEEVFPSVEANRCLLLCAYWKDELAGTVQLAIDMPPKQAHRGEVAKLIVHPSHRRKGIARALMIALEEEARAHGKTLITLDTRTGDSAEPLYASVGYETAGRIPNFAKAPDSDRLDATTFMYKILSHAA